MDQICYSKFFMIFGILYDNLPVVRHTDCPLSVEWVLLFSPIRTFLYFLSVLLFH